MTLRPALTALFFLCSLPSEADDLLSIYQKARANDPVFAAARAGRDAGIEKEAQGRSQLLPTLSLSASRSETGQDVKLSTAPTTYKYNYPTDSYGLTLTQPIYRKQNFASYGQGKAEAAKAEFDLMSAEHDLMLRAAAAYLGTLATQDAHEFAKSEKLAIDRLRTLAQRNFSVGQSTLVDVHEAQARYDVAVAQEILAFNLLDVRRESIRVLTGEPAGALVPLSGQRPPKDPKPLDIEYWATRAEQQNPQVKSREQIMASAREEVEKSRGGHHPTLDLSAAHTYSDAGGSVNGFGIESTSNQVALLFNLPLYQGGQTTSRVREAVARLEEARQRLDSARRQAAQQAREAYWAVTTGLSRAKALKLALDSNQRSLDTTVLAYERGVRNGVDVLNAQRELFRARLEFSRSRYDYLFEHLKLRAAAGDLSEADLADLNRYFSDEPAPSRQP
jgi:outer membrane protein